MNLNKEKNTAEILNKDEEQTLKTNEIALRLEIAESTVRKYSQELKKYGYEFENDLSGGRIYRLQDERAFYELIRLRKDVGVSLAMAANMVATQQHGESSDRPMSAEVARATRERMELRAFGEMQSKFLEEFELMKQEILKEIKTNFSFINEKNNPKLIEENELMKKEIDELRKETTETNRLLNELLKEKEEKKTEPVEKESLWKKIFK